MERLSRRAALLGNYSTAYVSNQGGVNQPMFAATGTGPIPRPLSGLSDLVDFIISYNPADIVLGGNSAGVAGGTLGIAYWQGRGPSFSGAGNVLNNGMLPVAPADSQIGRTNVADILKHYTRRVFTSIKVYLTPEITNTTNNGLFAIAATRGGADAVTTSVSNAATIATNSDTDVMTMKNAAPFRVYDSLVYDATWAIAGGDGPKQNEFNILNSDTNGSSVVNNAVDGAGLIPCCLYMGGASGSAATSGVNTVTHRCVIELTLHLLDYRGTITLSTPMLKKPILPIIEETPYVECCPKCDKVQIKSSCC